MRSKIYQVRVLDFHYQSNYEILNFKYLTYEVASDNEENAIKVARDLYMRGEKEAFFEELPFLMKIFSVKSKDNFSSN